MPSSLFQEAIRSTVTRQVATVCWLDDSLYWQSVLPAPRRGHNYTSEISAGLVLLGYSAVMVTCLCFVTNAVPKALRVLVNLVSYRRRPGYCSNRY